MAVCANKISHEVHDNRNDNRGGHADKGHPRPAKDAIEDSFHAKRRDSLDQDEASHTAKDGDNHNPGA